MLGTFMMSLYPRVSSMHMLVHSCYLQCFHLIFKRVKIPTRYIYLGTSHR